MPSSNTTGPRSGSTCAREPARRHAGPAGARSAAAPARPDAERDNANQRPLADESSGAVMEGRRRRRACVSCATAAWLALLPALARAQQPAAPQLPPIPNPPAGASVVPAPSAPGPDRPSSFADGLPAEANGALSSGDAEASLRQFLANVAP